MVFMLFNATGKILLRDERNYLWIGTFENWLTLQATFIAVYHKISKEEPFLSCGFALFFNYLIFSTTEQLRKNLFQQKLRSSLT